jgi:cellulose synthase/poly-beta-1,6-N-acetylglucosamine synthase-like glycosyltransferase
MESVAENANKPFVTVVIPTLNEAGRIEDYLDIVMRQDYSPDRFEVLVGDGPRKRDLAARAGRDGLTNVVFVDAVPKAEVADYINASDVCTATLVNIEHFARERLADRLLEIVTGVAEGRRAS